MNVTENKAVFLSYASQDAEAVRRIAETLRASGAEVWFDQNELVGGDAWDAKIRRQIASCALFVPVISAATQARLEGYFRVEWKLAARRTHAMATAKAFLLPVVIDGTRDADAHVPDEFREVQWTRLPGGEGAAVEKFCARVGRLLGGDAVAAVAGVADPGPASATPATTGPTPARVWLAASGAAVLAGVALAIWQPWKKPAVGSAPAPVAAPPAVTAQPPASEAQRLVQQAQNLLARSDELNRANLHLAEELVKRALALEPANPDAVLIGARLSYAFVWYLFDASAARREQLQQQAARAVALRPDSPEARRIQADAQTALFSNYSDAPVAFDLEKEARAIVALEPANWRAQRTLGSVLRTLNRRDESLAAHRRAYELSEGNPDAASDLINVLVRSGRHAEADDLRVRAMQGTTSARLLCWDVMLKLRWRGEAAAAVDALQAWPGWLVQEDRGLFHRWQAHYWSRRPAEAQRIARMAVRDWVRDFSFYGPTAVLRARAHEMAGNREAAAADWRVALEQAERELQAEADNEPGLYWKAWALARLDRVGEARPIVAVLAQRNSNSSSAFAKVTFLEALQVTVGDLAGAFAGLRRRLAAPGDSLGVTRAALELDPTYDGVRGDPEFQAILRDAPAPAPNAALTAAPVAVDDKSVAVLAFANLSDDKANEYFSDGISEELLNVVAKIPGLKVSARTSAFSFKGKNVPIPEIAQQLGVAYVVDGSVRKAGDKVRITAQLIKAADGFQVWSDTFTREVKDVFAVQDEIAGLIAQNLRLKISGPRDRAAPAPEVYALILQARYATARQTNEAAREAIALYRQALAREPKTADAWAELALAYVQLGRFGGLPTADAMREARLGARRALDLDPEHPQGLLALAWVQRTNDRDWRGAIASFRRALAAAPENVTIMGDAAICWLNVGFTDEALALSARAVERDPLNARAQWARGAILLWSGQPALAVEAYRRAVTLAPMGDEYHSHLARALSAVGRYPEALQEAGREPNERFRLVALATVQYQSGDRTGGDRTFNEIVEKFGDPMAGYLANLCAIVGKTDEAFRWWERGYDTRDAAMAWVKTNRGYGAVRADPRWEPFLRKMGLADDQLK